MKIYDVYDAASAQAGEDLQTTLYIHDDGRKTWEDSREWNSFYCDEDQKRAIAETIDRYPDQERFSVGLCIMRLRREPAK